MSSTSQVVQVQEIPRAPQGIMEALEILGITLSEFGLLWAARRDDIILHALQPSHVTQGQKSARESLVEKGLIEYSVYTSKWELTTAGQAIVHVAPMIMKGVGPKRNRHAEILQFPNGNSA